MNKIYDFAYEAQALTNDETVLIPYQHEISFDAYLIDSEYLAEPNRYGEYIATFQPLDMGAMHMIHERGEQAVTEVIRTMDSVSIKDPRPGYESRDGLIITSQLFPPKLNVDPTDTTSPFYQQSPQVSVKANFQDRKDGMVYLHIQYCDFYEPTPEPELKTYGPELPYIDF